MRYRSRYQMVPWFLESFPQFIYMNCSGNGYCNFVVLSNQRYTYTLVQVYVRSYTQALRFNGETRERCQYQWDYEYHGLVLACVYIHACTYVVYVHVYVVRMVHVY